MKKLMALCLAMLMALSMVSFSVMAEGTAVDFSAIANGQPAKFVTGNLVLGGHTITSSNETVIATDGTVTRPLFEDATVAISIDGGEAVNVTVKAKTTNVLYSTDFSVDDTPVSTKFVNYPGWATAAVVNTTAISGGKLNADHGTQENDKGRLYLYVPTCSGQISTKPVTYTFSISNVSDLATGIDFRFSGTKYDATGKIVGTISETTPLSMRSGTTFSGYGNGHGGKATNPVTFKYNPSTGEYVVNGYTSTNNLFNLGTTNEGATISRVAITSIYIMDAGGSSKGRYCIDDFAVYEDVSNEDAFASATPAEKVANYSTLLNEAYVANGGNLKALTGNLRFTADEALPADVTLTWTSSNPAIAADGTVKRPFLEPTTATITGKLSCGEASISKSYNVTILPLTVSGQSEVVDFDSYGLANGQAISGTGWTIASGTAVTNVVENGNSYAKVKTTSNHNSNRVRYNFASFPTSTERYYVMKFKFKSNAKPTTVYNIGLTLNNSQVANFVQKSGTVGMYGNNWGAGGTWFGTPAASDYFTTPTSFTELTIEIDKQENAIRYYVGDTLKNTTYFNGHASAGTNAAKNVDLSAITSANLHINWRKDGSTEELGEFCIDDIQFYAPRSLDNVISTLSDADKVDFYKELIEKSDIGKVKVGSALDLDNGYVDYNPATYGVAINWSSDNTAYISDNGTVNKLAPYGETVTVNMTATITAGGVTDTVILPVSVYDVTLANTTLHSNYSFSDYTVPAGATYEIVTDSDETHGDVLKLDSAAGTSAIIKPSDYGQGSRHSRFVIETDFKYDSNSTGYPCFIVLTGAGATGIRVNLNYNTGKVGLLTTKASLSNYDFAVSGSNMIYYDMPESVEAKKGEWTHLLIDYNALSETYQVSIDGIVINDIPVLNADIRDSASGGTFRHFYYNHSGTGVLYADNLSIKDYDDQNVVEVNAALNSALTLYANEAIHPVLSNRTLWDKTISHSWTNGTTINKDTSDIGNNPACYKVMEDSPVLTYTIDGNAATAISVTKATEAEITITATKNGYSESKTFTRKVVPVVINTLALGTENCLNGVWVEGASGTEKMILAKYLDEKLVTAEVIDFTVIKDKGSRYEAATGFVKDLSGYTHPNKTDAYDQIKLFVVKADGITPLTVANESLHD